MKNSYAPIVVFAYNRPQHLKRLITSLLQNELAAQSDLIVYCDGSKLPSNELVNETRGIAKNITGFRNTRVVLQKSNIGLAKSIITGVTDVVNTYGKVIVLEDDLVVSKLFLDYMNHALDRYQNTKKVWHINGWSYPVRIHSDVDSYFIRLMNCWGWATWKDRWSNFEKAPKKLISEFNSDEIHSFNLDGAEPGFWQQIVLNSEKRLDTWAIFWYATIFRNHGLCLSPSVTYVANNGYDGTGVHTNYETLIEKLNTSLNTNSYTGYPNEICENEQVIDAIKKLLIIEHEYVAKNATIGNYLIEKNILLKQNEKLASDNALLNSSLIEKKILVEQNEKLINEISILNHRLLQVEKINTSLSEDIYHLQDTKIWKIAEFLRKNSLFRAVKKIFKTAKFFKVFLSLKIGVSISKFIKTKNQLLDRSNKIVYVGHSYHLKTKSTVFLIDYLKEHFDVDVILDESWIGKPYPDLSFVTENDVGVVFFQNLPPAELVSKIKNKNIIFFPMYDGSHKHDENWWRQYPNLKIINFSKTLHEKLIGWNLNSIYVQYFPKPASLSLGNSNEVFFWQRLTNININTISALFKKSDNIEIHLHRAIDPYQEFVEPTKKQILSHSIKFSEWFDTREEMWDLVKSKALYIAPREYEGIGQSFLEAMAMGKAVIAVDNPTMNEYIVHGKTGYLFNLDNLKKIDLSKLRKIQKAAYNYMVEGYNQWEQNKSKIISFIKS